MTTPDPGSKLHTPNPQSPTPYSLLPTPYSLLPTPYFFLLALLLSIFAIGPLMQPGYFWGAHDARHSVYFLYEFDKSIQDGILWPRWGPDWAFGYGYPFWNIYGPLAYFVGEGVLRLGFDTVDATKIVFALSVLGSAAAMYLFVRRLLGQPAGLIAALVYVYMPYRLFDLYVRADLAESFSFVFIPLVWWGFFELVDRPRLNALIGSGLAYAGLVLTSNAGLLLITPPLGIFVALMLVLRLKDEGGRLRAGWGRRLKQLVRWGIPPASGLALGIGLSAIFVLPLLAEFNYVRVDQWTGGRFAFGRDFVYFFQLFSPQWGFGASIPGPDDQVSYQLGLAPVVLLALSFFAVPRIAEANTRRLLRFCQGMALVVAFLMTPASEWVWRTISLSTFAQFPWRLGVLSVTGMAVVAGSLGKEIGDWRLEVGSWKLEGGSRKLEDGSQKLEAGSRMPEEAQSLISNLQSPISGFLPVVSLAALIILASYPYLRAEVRDPKPTEGPVSLAALFRYQQSSDDMTGSTAWTRRIPGWSVLAGQVENGGSIDTKVNYAAIPPGDALGVGSVEMDSVHELVWVYAADDRQSVTFLTPYYPGWTATVYEDKGQAAGDLKARVGRPVATPALQTTPYEGWIVVPVPKGEHFLEVRFVDTPVRVAGRWISLVALLGVVGAVGARRVLRRPV
jgi:hypothetical protein